MRKVIGAIILLGVEGVGSVVLETTIIPTLFAPPLLFVLFGVLLASALMFFFPELKTWLDQSERIMRRGELRYERDRRSRIKAQIQAAREIGKLRDITYDPGTGRISGDFVPRSWKGNFLQRLAWLPNHRKMPASVYIWIVKRLGWTIREAEAKENATMDNATGYLCWQTIICCQSARLRQDK